MWSSSLATGALLVFVGLAQAEETRCPPFHSESPLFTGTVFDGPPEERADLIPDDAKVTKGGAYSTWEVGYIYDAGRSVFLVCRYRDEGISLTVPIPHRVTHCIYETRPDGPAALHCK